MRRGRLVAALLLLGLGVRGAGAEDTALPPGLANLAETVEDAARWEAALQDLRRGVALGAGPALRRARVRLHAGGAAALKHVAAALLAAAPTDPVTEHLALVTAASGHPEAAGLLAQLARSTSPSLRSIVADGLARAPTLDGPSAAALLELTRDPLPGVRAAALRALFAREEPTLVTARAALPADPDPGLEARRLAWHRLRGDAEPPIADRAAQAWATGASAALRLAGARLLATPGLVTPTATLVALVDALGSGPVAAVAARWLSGAPLSGQDPVEERRVAIEAALTALTRADLAPPTRARLVDRCVEWLAHPVPMDPRSLDPIPEAALRRRLPDLGSEVLAALERRFEPGGFAAPRDGTTLLAEMDPGVALPLLTRLVAAERPQPVRAAASGALRTLGTLGSEALAVRLTAPEEDASIRRDAIAALAAEAAPWALPRLAALLDAADAETVEAAADALDERAEPGARAHLEAFVLDGRCPENRLPPRLARLLAPWGADAHETWSRALASARGALRAAALSLAARLPPRALADVLGELRAYAPRLQGAAEVEAWIATLLRAAPAEGLAWIRARWDDFPVGASLASTRCRALAALDVVRARDQTAAVVDLVLEKVGSAQDAHLLEHALEALAGRQGARDDALDALFARLLRAGPLAGSDERGAEVAAAAVSALERPGRGDLVAPLLHLLEGYLADPEQTHRAVAVLRALAHQPWEKVEGPVVAVALDGTLPAGVRSAAGWLLKGRASPPARRRVLDWLLGPGASAPDPQVLLALAAAAGAGGGPETAAALEQALRTDLLAFYADAAALDPFAERLDALPVRIQALAAGVAHTGHAPALDALAGLLVEERFAAWPDAVLRHLRLAAASTDALSALDRPAEGRAARLEDGSDGASVVVPEVATLALGLKALGDEALAASLGRVLAEPGTADALGAFPDAWAFKLAALLREPRTRDHVRAAEVFTDRLALLEPVDGPFDLALAEGRAQEALRAGRFDDAAQAFRTARALLARRGAEWEPQRERAWLRARALETACRGALRAELADDPGAVRAFQAALADAGDLPETLSQIARAVAPGGFADDAEALARRALALERRAEGEESLDGVGALAEVLMRRGRPGAAARRLGEALGKSLRAEHGRLHLLHAFALAAHGDRAGALEALKRALRFEPSLDAEARAAEAFAPLREDGSLARALEEAAAAEQAGSEE